MAVHSEVTPAEAAVRLAPRELFDAYAHGVDRRDAEAQRVFSTDDTSFPCATPPMTQTTSR
jgi:hypothetical protein